MRYPVSLNPSGLGRCLAAVLFLVLPSFPLSAASPEPPEWMVGVAVARITPEEPIWLSGYAGRSRPSEGVDHDLYAKALAIDDRAGGRLVIVTMDLIGVHRETRIAVQEAVQRIYGLRPDQLLLNAAHTHCGPELNISEYFVEERGLEVAEVSRRYLTMLRSRLVELVGEALAAPEPARLEHSHARAGFAMNRRRPNPDGTISLAAYPDGPVDHETPTLKITGAAGELKAVLFGYACHNTTFGSRHYGINGDYSGYAVSYLEAGNPGAVALFLTGCGADQNPYPRAGDPTDQSEIELAQQHGRALANAVGTALNAGLKPVRGPLRTAFDYADLKYRFSTPEEFAQRIAAARGSAARQRLVDMSEQVARGTAPKSYPWPVQVAQFGQDLTLVALGSEVVVDYALRLKRELAGPARIWMAGYSNDYYGYLPSRRVLREGGYEAAPSWRPGPWDESVEDVVVAKVHELWRRVNR